MELPKKETPRSLRGTGRFTQASGRIKNTEDAIDWLDQLAFLRPRF